MIERFLRKFSAYRELEKELHFYKRELELSVTIVQSGREAIVALRKKVESDANLIDSLNRHIEALEGKAEMQAKQLQKLRAQLENLMNIAKNPFENLTGLTEKTKEDLP